MALQIRFWTALGSNEDPYDIVRAFDEFFIWEFLFCSVARISPQCVEGVGGCPGRLIGQPARHRAAPRGTALSVLSGYIAEAITDQ